MAYALHHPRLRPIVLAVLLCFLGAGLGSGDESSHNDGIVVMEWSVRQDIQELLDRLDSSSDASPELLDATQAVLTRYGNRPFLHLRRYRPVADLIHDILEEREFDRAFRRQFATVAERELEQALGTWDETALLSVAVSYPHTPAAEAAWKHLAQRAWDTGRLGLFLTWAQRGGGAGSEQIAAAQALLEVDPIPHLPTDLAPLGRMWGLSIPVFSSSDRSEQRDDRLRLPAHSIPPQAGDTIDSLQFSLRSEDGVLAVSDGRHLALFDPLIGNLIASPVRLGRHHLDHQPATAGSDRFIALGVDERRRFQVTAVASNGELAWRSRLSYHMHSALISDPVVIDHVVGLAVSERQGDGTQIRLLGLHLHDGTVLFDHALGKDTRDVRNHWGRRRGDNSPQPPSLTAHAGTFAISTGTGLIATLAADGSTTGIWTSTTRIVSPLDDGPGRSANLLSDGRYLVASNRHDGALTIISPLGSASTTQRYTGDGATGVLLALRNGLALTSGRRITLIDLATQDVRWSVPSNHAGSAQAWGHIGEDHVLVAAGSVLSLIDRKHGTIIDERFFDRDASITSAAGMIISAHGEHLIGYGDRESFMQRLRADMQRNPEDYRPLASLYALHRAQGNHDQAFTYAWQALQRGAPERFAEEAAMILRDRLSLSLGSDGFSEHLQRLRQLGSMLAHLEQEAWWWQGRHHEQRQRPALAKEAYAKIVDQPRNRIRLANGLIADNHALAHAGLARLGERPMPSWATMSLDSSPSTPATDSSASDAWSDDTPRLGKPLLNPQQSLIVGYYNGDLQAQRSSDGSLLWRRPIQAGDRSFLGLSFAPDVGGDQRPGLTIEVIIGTAAAAAGFQSGDRMLRFSGTAIHQPQDLIDAIAQLPAGAAFSADIERRDEQRVWQEKTISGNLGARMQQPIAIGDNIMVTQAVTLGGHPRHQQLVPDPEDTSLRILSLEDGSELYRLRLDHENGRMTNGGLQEVMIVNNLVLLEHAAALVAYDISPLLRRAEENVEHRLEPRWQLPGMEGILEHPRLLADRYLLTEHEQDERLLIIDLHDGVSLFDLPARAGNDALINQGELIVAESTQRTTAWDLGRGLRRWSHDRNAHTPLAIHGDTVFALSKQGHLTLLERANGRQRRVVSGLQLIEHAEHFAQHLWIHARNSEGRQLLAQVSMDSGTVLWQRFLPPGSEIRNGLTVNKHGVTFELSSQSHPHSLVTIDSTGSLTGVVTSPSFGFARILDDGRAFFFDNQRLAIIPQELPPKPPTIAMPQISAGPPASMLEAAANQLQWQSISTHSRWAPMAIDQRLGIMVELDRATTHLHIYLGNQGPDMDPYGQRLAITRGETPTLTTQPHGWRLNAFHRLGDDEEGRWRALLVVSRADPMAMPGNVEVLATSNHDRRDDLPWPWWLRRIWSPLRVASDHE